MEVYHTSSAKRLYSNAGSNSIVFHLFTYDREKANCCSRDYIVYFNFYLIGILTLTGICLRGSFSPRIVFIPFVDMIKGPKDTILNVLLFIPLGCFLPLLYEQYDSIGKIAFMGFLVSLSVEIVQMFGYGATDINDLITNTIGACLGFFIFTILYRMIPRSWLKLIRVEGTQCYYEPLFFWIASILVMLTVQIYIFHEFFPAKMGGGEIQEWK